MREGYGEKPQKNNMSKHMEPGKQDVCGKENRLFTIASSYIMVGTISTDFVKGRMILKFLSGK